MAENFMDLFGISEEDLVKKEDTKKKPKVNKQKETKKSTSGSNKQYALPIKICAGHLSLDIHGDEKTLKETSIKNKLKDAYQELSGLYFTLSELPREKTEDDPYLTYLTLDISYKEIDEKQKLSFPLSIVTGKECMEIKEECSIQQLLDAWIVKYPEFRGCKFHYDDVQNILLPFMEGNLISGKYYNCPVTIGYLDCIKTYTEDDLETQEINIETLRKKYSEDYPEFAHASFHYDEENNHLFPIVNVKKINKDVKRVALPVEVRAAGFCLIISPKDLNGKESATLDQIRESMEETYPEFSKERTEMLYDERHFIVPILKGSRKGITYIPKWKNQNQYFVKARDNGLCRIEQMPYGQFASSAKQDHDAIEFHLGASKIPKYILKEIIDRFRKTPDLEAAAQLFFEPDAGTYHLYFPKQTVTQSSVQFVRDHEMESRMVLMMDVHSHAGFPAFFSATDNADEKGLGLYLVIGNLNKVYMSYCLRAGLAGQYVDLDICDIFDLDKVKGGHVYGLSV